MNIITCIAPVNIAVIKYWGKSDEDLIIPLNDSLSGTLSTKHMCAKTTVMLSPNFKQDTFWLNGKEESTSNPRFKNCLREIKSRANVSKEMLDYTLHICSENNFPTAAGLASSAAGYACLVSALAALYRVSGNVSGIARQGSGSACRSVYGGWVQWHTGSEKDGSDSIARQVAPASHWPEVRVMVLVVNEARKKVSSTEAMARSGRTSELLRYRVKECVPARIAAIRDAIIAKDWDRFATITMQDSNQFHAVCLDTYPPVVYMNEVSHLIVELVHAFNEYRGGPKVAYTFDAGPNACLYMCENEVPLMLALINKIFPPKGHSSEYFKGNLVPTVSLPKELETINVPVQVPGALKYIINTEIGEGPQLLTDEGSHLLNTDGYPKQQI